MKVVLFCGGMGTRIRDYAENTPKPMVPVGNRPILWHVMKYYAHFGHRDFILCLGYRSDAIREYFAGKAEWNITFVDTGLNATIGQRLKAIEPYLDGDEMFLANYSDGLSDVSLDDQLAHFRRQAAVASFLCVRPNLTYHFVTLDPLGRVSRIADLHQHDVRINGGFFIFKREIFQYVCDGEELLQQPFQRLIAEGQLAAFPYDGFWMSMDTFKDRERLEALVTGGRAPWLVWSADSKQVSR